MKKSRPYVATHSPMHLLHRTSQYADELFAHAASGLGLTARQFVVLAVVADISDPSQTLICEKSGIDRSTLADIVARLVTRGLLSRRRTRLDGRKYAVRLTDAGRKCLDEAIPAAQQVDAMLMRSMPVEQQSHLGACLDRILVSARTVRPATAALPLRKMDARTVTDS